MMTVKASTADMCDLTPIQVQERAITKHAFLRLPHRKCMGKYLIGCKCCAEHLNKKILKYLLVDQGVPQMSQISRSCVIVSELLNVFEDSAQRVHTIFIVSNPRCTCLCGVLLLCVMIYQMNNSSVYGKLLNASL